MTYRNILLENEEQIGVITINRPDVRNALNIETAREILDAMEVLENDEEIGVIVFTGAGHKSFAAGADINQLSKEKSIREITSGGMTNIYRKIENCKKATIAAVNGFALGGGCELAMSCDIRIASENAKFGLPELNLSIIPGAGGTQRLSRIVGKGRAMDMVLTGDFIDANEAKSIGLVSEVVPLENLWDAVLAKAEKIMSKGPLSVQLAKLVINTGYDVDMDTGLVIENLALALLYGTKDRAEGTRAFLEKRKAVFTGN